MNIVYFSGDGSGCGARLLKKYGAKILGGLHLQMPDTVADVKLLKKSPEKNRMILKTAEEKINRTAKLIQSKTCRLKLHNLLQVRQFLSKTGNHNYREKDF